MTTDPNPLRTMLGSIPASATMRRATDRDIRSPQSRRRDDPAVAASLRKLFPGRDRTSRLATAFERSRTSIEEIMAGRNVPRDVRLIVGLLEACPFDEWPPRWKQARSQHRDEK